jgi:hypothetical protein
MPLRSLIPQSEEATSAHLQVGLAGVLSLECGAHLFLQDAQLGRVRRLTQAVEQDVGFFLRVDRQAERVGTLAADQAVVGPDLHGARRKNVSATCGVGQPETTCTADGLTSF